MPSRKRAARLTYPRSLPSNQAICQLFVSLKAKLDEDTEHESIRFVKTVNDVTAVSNDCELDYVVYDMKPPRPFIVLKPSDRYTGTQKNCGPVVHDMCWIGLGSVTFTKRPREHLLFAEEPMNIHIENVQVTSADELDDRCAIAMLKGGSLSMSKCELTRLHGGVMVVGGVEMHATDCRISHIGLGAIQVSLGSSLVAQSCEISDANYGINLSGGAKSCILRRVTFERCKEYALLVDGNTKPKYLEYLEEFKDTKARKFKGSCEVDRILNASAKKQGLSGMVVAHAEACVFRSCVFEKAVMCQFSGLATFVGCSFESNNAGMIVQQGSSTRMSQCRFTGNQIGVSVSGNYYGNVEVEGCFFYKNKKHHIEESKDMSPAKQAMSVRMQMWSLPVVTKDVNIVETKQEFPSMDDIIAASAQKSQRISKLQQSSRTDNLPREPSFVPYRQTLYFHRADNYYPIGNTRGFDLLEHVTQPGGCVQRMLLAACGDLRNLLETVVAWWKRNPDGALEITLNDFSPSTLARNILLLHMVRTMDDEKDMVTAVSEVWGSLGLQPKTAEAMRTALEELKRTKLEQAGCADRVRSMLVGVVEGWLSCPLDLKALQRERDRHMHPIYKRTTVDLAVAAIASSSTPTTTCVPAVAKSKKKSNRKRGGIPDEDIKRIKAQVESGSYSKKCTRPNVTLLEAPNMQWNVYWSSSIYRMAGTADLGAFFAERLPVLRAALRSGKLRISTQCCDLFQIEVPRPKFDVADFTNAADYVGLPNVLAFAGWAVDGPVYLEQMRWTTVFNKRCRAKRKTPPTFDEVSSAFVCATLGVASLEDAQRLSGFRLAHKREGGNTFADWLESGITCVLRMRWEKAKASTRLSQGELTRIAGRQYFRLGLPHAETVASRLMGDVGCDLQRSCPLTLALLAKHGADVAQSTLVAIAEQFPKSADSFLHSRCVYELSQVSAKIMFLTVCDADVGGISQFGDCTFALVTVAKGTDPHSGCSESVRADKVRQSLLGYPCAQTLGDNHMIQPTNVCTVLYQMHFNPKQGRLLFLGPNDFVDKYGEFKMFLVKEQIFGGPLVCASEAWEVYRDVTLVDGSCGVPAWW